MRVLLDANVLISALLSRVGAPARLLEASVEARLEIIICPELVSEIERAFARPKLRARIEPADVARFVELLREVGEAVPDPAGAAPTHTADPGDDYLLALAAREQVPLVSGDDHLLALRDRAPIFSPREFLEQLD